jgi:TetR/AcrR family transcriptional repressor of nem operon
VPVSAARKARTRAEIFEHAARLFRLRGYAGTNIDDIMLAAGLTRGAFYAHFRSKGDLFAEVVLAGHGLLAAVRAADAETALAVYLDKAALAANAQACTLAALPGDVARAPMAARLAYANVLYALIGELARGRRRRRLDADATTAAILAVGALALARACGDTRLRDWLLRCARRAALPLLRPRASPSRKRSRSRRKAAGARPARRAARSHAGRASP